MKKLLMASLVGAFVLSGCSSVVPSLLGGGPKVAANGQAGVNNAQTIGTTDQSKQTLSVEDSASVEVVRQSKEQSKVRTEAAENVTVNEVSNVAWGVMFALIVALAFAVPSPFFKRKEK